MLTNTRLQDFVAQSNVGKNEIRGSRYGVLEAYYNMSYDENGAPLGLLSTDLLERSEKSAGSTLKTAVLQHDAGISISNTRSVTIPIEEGSSAFVTVTFVTYAFGFTIIPARHENNEIKKQEYFNKRMQQYINKFHKTLDSAGLVALAAGRSQVFGESLTYTVSGNAIQVPYTERNNALGHVGPIMGGNDFDGPFHIIGNGGLEAVVGDLTKEGNNQAVNQQKQLNDKTFGYSPRILNSTGQFANFYAVEEGSLGVLFRFDPDSRLRTETGTGHKFGVSTLPGMNLPIGTYYYDTVEDVSGQGADFAHLTRAAVEHYGFSVDVAWLTPYVSAPATMANSIMQFTIANPV